MGFRVMGAVLWLTGAVLPCPGQVAEPDWYVEAGGNWKSRASGLDTSLLVSVDGRPVNPIKPGQSGGNASVTTINGSTESVIKTTINKVAVSHETQLDGKRNALRILDVLTNNDTIERRVRVEFRTQMRSNRQLKYNGFISDGGDVLENGNSVPDQTRAIILLAELPDTPALPLIVWGDRDAAWPVTIREVGGGVSLGYEGVIKPGEKAALVHWVGTAGLDKAVKLERTFDLFLKDGKLIDPMIPEDVRPYVVNFKPESVINTPAAAVVPASGRLVALEILCEKLGLERGRQDIVWMSKDEMFRGEVKADKFLFLTGDQTVEMDWKDIAAIRGGGGRGRQHRVYLRDGAVWDGRIQSFPATLKGDIGTMTLNADGLELLLNHTQSGDGVPAEGSQGFAQTLSGRQFWIRNKSVFKTTWISSFGEVTFEADDIWSGQRKPEPPFQQTLTLLDGSRIQGFFKDPLIMAEVSGVGASSLSAAELSRWGTMDAWQSVVDSRYGKPEKTVPPPTRYCWLRDGSFLVGTLTDSALVFHTRQEDITIKSQDIARITTAGNDSGQLTVELLNGAKIKGQFLQDSVTWQLGKQVVTLPVGQITELVRKDQP